jgi:toxin ParE1/3/4
MRLPVIFIPSATLDMIEAADYLDTQLEGFGDIFLEDVTTATEIISEFPECASVSRGSTRRKVLLRFPYSLLYRINANGIHILAVAHNRRKPGYWIRRK